MPAPVLNLDKISQVLAQLQLAISNQSLQRLVLSKYQGVEALKQVQVRPVLIKQQRLLSFTYKYQTNDITKNLSLAAAIAEVTAVLGNTFFAVHLFTTTSETQLTISKKGKCLYQHKMLVKATAQPIELEKQAMHNREKSAIYHCSNPIYRL